MSDSYDLALGLGDRPIRVWDYHMNTIYTSFRDNQVTLRKLFDVLTPAQQKTLLDWVGEPYDESNSWKVLQSK